MICCGLELKYWPIAKEYLSKSIEMSHGAFDADDVYKMIENRDAQLWGIHEGELKAVAVTMIMNYPKQKRLRLFLLGGDDMSQWEQLVSDTFDAYALEQGCAGVELLGRRGWARNLKQFGYDEYEVTMIKTFKSCEGP